MHRATFVYVFLVALALPAIARAQATVRGTVLDEQSHQPIVGATVRLLELDRLQITGAGGRFAFLDVPKGRYRVFARTMGYAAATQIVEVSGGQAVTTVALKRSAILLPEVVVSASPYARPADEQYQSAESKSQIEFDNSVGTSFAEKISDLPGVSVRGNGSAPSRPILRGLSDNRVLVLENGLRDGDIATYDPAHATPMEAMGIAQIDVVRGPATILYGPSTIGGLVNVITNIVPTVSSRPVSGTVSIEGNSVSDEYSGYFNTVYSAGASAFRISAGGLHSQDIRIPSGTYADPVSGMPFPLDRMPQSFDHSSEVGLGYAFQGDFGSIGLGGKHYEMNYGIPGVPPNPNWSTVPPATSRITQRRNTVELRGLFSSNGSWIKQWKLEANYNDYNHSEFPTVQDSSGVSDPQANHFHKREFNGRLQFQHQPLGHLQGVFGAWTDIQNLTIEGDQPLGPNSVTTGFAGYALEEYRLSGGSSLQGGLRYDYNKIQTRPYPQSSDSTFQTLDVSQLSNAVTASLGVLTKFTPGITGTLSLARSFRAPTVQELFANGLDAASGTYSVGTATLAPETGYGIDASLKGSFNRLDFSVSPYVNIIRNYIYGFLRGDTLEGFPVRQFTATDARLAGFEASVEVQPMVNLALRASTDYVQAEDTRNNVPLPFTPPWRGLLRGTYQESRYVGMIEWRGAARVTRLGIGDTPTGGYGVVNLGVGVRLTERGVLHDISLHCDNVFNRVYRDNLSVIKDFIPQPARGFRLNYELIF